MATDSVSNICSEDAQEPVSNSRSRREEDNRSKARVALLSIASNTTLVILKLAVGLMTGAVSIVSEAIHSGLDLLAAVIAYISIKISNRPPDERHHYGHGKFENISGTIEAVLILVAAVWIIMEAYEKLVGEARVENPLLGVAVMAVAAVANWFISGILMRTGKRTNSIALEADAMHLRTDVYTSLGVLVGMGLIALTGIQILDPIIAIGVALLIIKASIELTIKAFAPLMDSALPAEEQDLVRAILEEARPLGVMDYHKLRTRHSGPDRYIDLHVLFRKDLSFSQVHDMCDLLEDKIGEQLHQVHVMVHPEPYKEDHPLARPDMSGVDDFPAEQGGDFSTVEVRD